MQAVNRHTGRDTQPKLFRYLRVQAQLRCPPAQRAVRDRRRLDEVAQADAPHDVHVAIRVHVAPQRLLLLECINGHVSDTTRKLLRAQPAWMQNDMYGIAVPSGK